MKKKKLLMLLVLFISFNISSQEIQQIRPDANEKYARPIWSPNGKMLAFTNQTADVIYIHYFNTNTTKVLVSESGIGYKFQWSFDSKHIAYRATEGVGANRIQYIAYINIDNGNTTKVSENKSSLQPPWWHYNNGKIYVAYLNNDKIELSYVSNIDKNFDDNINTWAVFINDNLYITNGYSLNKITNEVSFDPVFSPDKSKMFYSSLSGLHILDLTSLKDYYLGDMYSPSWSPNGKSFIFKTSKDDGHHILEADIYHYNIDNQLITRLTNTIDELEENPQYSPCGTKISYNTMLSGEIIIMNIN